MRKHPDVRIVDFGLWDKLTSKIKIMIIKMANEFEPKGEQRNVFGEGKADERIVKIIGGLQ